jgi:hypothetical protein
MTYAHVTSGTVDAITVKPPQTVFANGRWYDLRTLDAATLALAGWYVVAEAARPADTATTTTVAAYALSGGVVVQSWQTIPKTAAQIAAESAETNRQSIESALDAQLVELQATIDATNATINSNAAAHIKVLARAARRIIRLLIRRLDGTT